ncbi:MAG: FMN-binding protein [Spirochaetales bacterium]|nr:FMN-binding protein [Spirochaetales bacterium]
MTATMEKAGKLALICAISATLLGFVNSMTEPAIATRKAAELKAALSSLLEEGSPGAKEDISDAGSVTARYPVEGAGGWILEFNGKGYGGDMKILASYNEEGTILDVVLMDNAETPGLGKKAEKSEYMDKFRGTGGSAGPVPVTKDALDSPDSVSGATITFVGIAAPLNEGSAYVQSLGGN